MLSDQTFDTSFFGEKLWHYCEGIFRIVYRLDSTLKHCTPQYTNKAQVVRFLFNSMFHLTSEDGLFY